MKELQYPFNAPTIMKKKKKLRRQLLESGIEFIDKKIAILGGSTTNDIKLAMELFLLDQGIRPEFYESEYNQWYQDAVFPNKQVEEFAPDVIYIYTTNRNISSYPDIKDTKEQINVLLNSEFEKYISVWENLREKYHCPIIQNNFEMPSWRMMGNRDAWDIHGATNFLTRMNMKFYEYAETHDDFYICDINYISADYGLSEWQDSFYWHMYKYALHVNAIPYLAYNVSNIIKSIFGKNKKGFVFDLDNTLWGGVIGDDGVENIILGPEESEGQAFSEFQSYIKEFEKLGIFLTVDSKNDYDNAVTGIMHPDSKLSLDDFIVVKANWLPKDENFKEIAKEINVLPESLVFIDDNPAERHIVTEQLKGVCAPDIGKVTDYIRIIDRSGFFEVTNLSEDDFKRNDMYRENAERAVLKSSFVNYNDYLKSLEMKGIIRDFDDIYIARIAQLTNKSNQFNLTTKRYTQSEIEKVAKDKNYISLYGKLIDRFGDNGVVSVLIGRVHENICDIELWLMSCRVLKRDMEFAMMDGLIKKCKEKGVEILRGYYYPTAKNAMVKDFYGTMGFCKICKDEKGNSEWEYRIPPKYSNKNKIITVEGE